MPQLKVPNIDCYFLFEAVTGKGFVAVNITFQNTAGSSKHQAVAVRNGADMSVFYNCSFEGYQDTLYAHSLRQFYKNCNIYGTVDFIFGNAAAIFQNCNIYPRLPMQNQFNAITAQGRTDPNQNTGFSIWNCYIVAAKFANWGQGSYTSNRVTWKGYHQIDGKNADEFTVYKFIQGDMWLPMTGVPFRAGL
ncbi:putative pectinesterase/pectinesterase inhibitor 41-like [Trifolium medium]|uniref:Pectinesterase n=1 Tax=Trifolium medium TaxID=97028 RepID=A0A392NTS1_9FABA|nr:putative pectinesterase/pectinesterase inhibitor 41-like [Trifolium medium]